MSEADRQLAQKILKLDNLPAEFKSSIPKILQLDPIYKVLLKQLPDLTDTVTTILGAGGYATQAWVSSQGYETSSHASATYETSSHASSTYETQSHASSTYETQSHAASTYMTQAAGETASHAAATYATIASVPTFVTDILASDESTSTTAASGGASSSLSLSLSAGTWMIDLVMIVNMNASPSGACYCFDVSSTSTIVTLVYNYASGNAGGNETGYSLGDATFDGKPSHTLSDTTINAPVFGTGIVKIAGSRTVTLKYGPQAASTMTNRAGSMLRAYKIA